MVPSSFYYFYFIILLFLFAFTGHNIFFSAALSACSQNELSFPLYSPKSFFLEIYHLLQYLFSALLMSTLKITFNTSKTDSTTPVFQMSVLWSRVQNQELCTLKSGELDTNDTGQSKKISHKPKRESLSTIQY